MALWQDFKSFALKGNVIDLAIAVVIGAAFARIVTTVVDALIMPLVGKLLPASSYAAWAPGGVKLGLLLAAIVEFLVIAVVLFAIVSLVKRALERKRAAPAVEPSDEVKLLTEIRDLLRSTR